MKLTLFAYSKKGVETGRRIMAAVEGRFTAYTVERLACCGFLPIPKPSAPLYEQAFNSSEALVFVSSCGIAVRSIAPYIRSKTEDPAVVVIDETGRFVISLLSGHIGGANALAKRIAEAIGAAPVITTATDVNARFPVDAWAKEHGFAISDMGLAKAVSAAILEGDVPVRSDFPLKGELPAGLKQGEGETGVYLTYTTAEPFKNTLRLVPKCLRLGIGCRRGVAEEAIKSAVEKAFFESGIDPRAIKCAASIDLKKDEAGLLSYCREAGLPVSFYSPEELKKAKGSFTASAFVAGVTGVDNVCERAAMLGANSLIIKKTAVDGVTVAAALIDQEVQLG